MNKVILLLAAVGVAAALPACSGPDSTSFELGKGASKLTCAELFAKKNKCTKKGKDRGVKVKASVACPQACGACCGDSEAWFYGAKKKGKTCAGLAAKKPGIRARLCKKKKGKKLDVKAKKACPAACGRCVPDAPSLELVDVVYAGSEENGMGSYHTSAGDGDLVALAGEDTDGGGGDEEVWLAIFAGAGAEPVSVSWEAPRPRFLLAANGVAGVVAIYVAGGGSDDDREAVLRLVDTTGDVLVEFVPRETPAAIAAVSRSAVAVVDGDAAAVVLYDDGEVAWTADLSASVDSLAHAVWDDAAGALFLSGGGGVARLDVVCASYFDGCNTCDAGGCTEMHCEHDGAADARCLDYDPPRVAWVADFGDAPRPLLRRSSVDAAATEVLLLGAALYARVSSADGSTLLLRAEGDLPPGHGDYDPVRDGLFSTSGTTLRRHDAETGGLVEAVDFDAELAPYDPAHSLADFPPPCGEETYPDHPDVAPGTWADVHTHLSSSGRKVGCRFEERDECHLVEERTGVTWCSDVELCCIGDDCCLLELDQDNWWKDGGKVLRSVHPSEDGRLRTVLVFSGGIYDEEGYYEAHLAVFDQAKHQEDLL